MTMSPNPIFPANRAELKAFAGVLDIACVDTRAAYDKSKAGRVEPAVSDVAGSPYRACAFDAYSFIRSGECQDIFDNVMICNRKNEYDYGRQCKVVRDALLKCAVKNKVGELGKNYSF